MLLRPGNAGSNTVTDHIRVLSEAIAQVPVKYRRKILIRIDGAGATHDLLEHIHQLNRRWRTVKFTVGWTTTDTDETAINQRRYVIRSCSTRPAPRRNSRNPYRPLQLPGLA